MSDWIKQDAHPKMYLITLLVATAIESRLLQSVHIHALSFHKAEFTIHPDNTIRTRSKVDVIWEPASAGYQVSARGRRRNNGRIISSPDATTSTSTTHCTYGSFISWVVLSSYRQATISTTFIKIFIAFCFTRQLREGARFSATVLKIVHH